MLPFEGLLVLLSLWKIAFFETPFVLRHSVYSQFFFIYQRANKELVDNEFVFRELGRTCVEKA